MSLWALPPELLELTLDALDAPDILSMFTTCRRMADVIAPRVWKTLSVRMPGVSSDDQYNELKMSFTRKNIGYISKRLRRSCGLVVPRLLLVRKLEICLTGGEEPELEQHLLSILNTLMVCQNITAARIVVRGDQGRSTRSKFDALDQILGCLTKLRQHSVVLEQVGSLAGIEYPSHLLSDRTLRTLTVSGDIISTLGDQLLPAKLEHLIVTRSSQQTKPKKLALGKLLASAQSLRKLHVDHDIEFSDLSHLPSTTAQVSLVLHNVPTAPVRMPHVRSFSVSRPKDVQYLDPLDNHFEFDHLETLKMTDLVTYRNLDKMFTSNPYIKTLQLISGTPLDVSQFPWLLLHLNTRLEKLVISSDHISNYITHKATLGLPRSATPNMSLEYIQIVTDWDHPSELVNWRIFQSAIKEIVTTCPSISHVCLSVKGEPHAPPLHKVVAPREDDDNADNSHPDLVPIVNLHQTEYLDCLHEMLCQTYLF